MPFTVFQNIFFVVKIVMRVKIIMLCRSLEYTIHDHELRDTRKKLESVQEKRENSGAASHKLRDQQQQAADQIKVCWLMEIGENETMWNNWKKFMQRPLIYVLSCTMYF